MICLKFFVSEIGICAGPGSRPIRTPSVQPHRSLLFEAPVIVAHVWFLRKTQRPSERTPAKTPPPLPLPRG